MADATITPAEVRASSAASIHHGTFGATITAGTPMYKDTDGTLKAGDADGTAAQADLEGIALNGGSAGQLGVYTDYDPQFDPGFAPSNSAAGAKGVYVLSDTAGGVKPVADLAEGDRPVILYVANDANTVFLKIVKSAGALTA